MGFVDPLKDVSVPEKKQAKFECTITKDVSKVMWFRGVEIVTPSPKYEIIDDGKKHMLIINSCEFDDEAQYTIEVLGQKQTAQLTVEGKCSMLLMFPVIWWWMCVALKWQQPCCVHSPDVFQAWGSDLCSRFRTKQWKKVTRYSLSSSWLMRTCRWFGTEMKWNSTWAERCSHMWKERNTL